MSGCDRNVVEAGPPLIEAVLRESHALWGAGMGLAEYTDFNLRQTTTPWGRDFYRFLVALGPGGEILSSLKLYTLAAEMDGRDIRVAGVGAVFTPETQRGRGHAPALVESALGRAAEAGCDAALLMSEIGGDYYEKLGFAALPAQEAACMAFLPVPWPKEPAWVAGGDPFLEVPGLRNSTHGDVDALVAIREGMTRGQRFRLRRDRAAWDHIMEKRDRARSLRGQEPATTWVVERGGSIQAYVCFEETRKSLRWEEHGSRPEAGEVLVDLFWAVLGRARRLGVGRIDAWTLPAEVTRGQLYPIARRPMRNPVPMIRSLGERKGGAAFATPEECRLSWLELF